MKKIEQTVINFIQQNILLQSGDKVLIALSGGPDSVFLLRFLKKYQRKFKITLSAFHLNHQLRGKSADADEKFCRKLCDELAIPFYSSSINVSKFASSQKISVEEAGRSIRYAELKRIAEGNGCTKIATGHIADDNAETVLLNLIKGTGLKGISGIPVTRGNIIRPLLSISKAEILQYLRDCNLKYRKDKSNLSNDYERNLIRNKIIPIINQQLNPSFSKSILKSSKNFRDHLIYFEKKLTGFISSVSDFNGRELELKVNELNKLEEIEKSEIIRFAIERNFSVQTTFNDVAKILSLLKKETGTVVNLSGKISAAKERDKLFVYRQHTEKKFIPLKLEAGEKVKLNNKTLFINSDISKLPEQFSGDRSVEYISADNAEDLFTIRQWKSGDRFYPLGLKGSKKISDFLNEQKILSTNKKEQLLLTNAGKIVWVIGLRIDDRFKITKSTKRIYQLCLI